MSKPFETIHEAIVFCLDFSRVWDAIDQGRIDMRISSQESQRLKIKLSDDYHKAVAFLRKEGKEYGISEYQQGFDHDTRS